MYKMFTPGDHHNSKRLISGDGHLQRKNNKKNNNIKAKKTKNVDRKNI